MGARSNIKGRVPSCRGTEGPRASHHSCTVGAGDTTDVAPHMSAIEFDSGEIFKKTPCAAGLQPLGRYVAKDMRETGVIPLLMKTLFDNGRGNCLTVTARTITEDLTSVKGDPRWDLARSADDAAVGTLNES